MINKSQDFITKLALFRAYSWTSTALLGIIACLFANNTNYLGAIILSLILWFSLNYISEFLQKDKGRSTNTIYLIVLILLCVLFASNNLFAFLCNFIFLLLCAGYGIKKVWKLGYISYIFRGIQQVLLFLTVYFFCSGNITNINWYFVIVVFSLVAGRNLIGDLRDVKHDKLTLATKSIVLAKIVSFILLLITCIFSYLFIKNIYFLIPIVLMIILLLLFNQFKLHRICIILTSCYFVGILIMLTNNYWYLLAIPIDIILSKLFYKKVYRESNKYI